MTAIFYTSSMELDVVAKVTIDFSVKAKDWVLQALGIEKRHSLELSSSEYSPRTPIGHRLWELRQKIVASGQPLLTWDQIHDEVARRRGEIE